jgi:nucleotide-binding universal stress UspA family protein
MKTIVITTDFSDGSKQVVRYGLELAKQLKANVTLCNAMIIPAEIPQTGLVGWPPDVFEELMEDSTKELNKLKDELVAVKSATDDEFNPVVSFVSQAGTVCDVVNQVIDLQDAGLVVLSSHKNEGLGQWLIGNHAQRLIDNCDIPLLLVPAGTHFKKIRKIAFATDFQNMQEDLNCIRKLLKMAKPLNAGILLIHVHDEKHNTSQIQRFLSEIVKELTDKTGYPEIDGLLIKGSWTATGLDWLNEHGHADMLAMVHRKHCFFASLFKGSHTQKMAAHIDIPLLVFPDKSSV